MLVAELPCLFKGHHVGAGSAKREKTTMPKWFKVPMQSLRQGSLNQAVAKAQSRNISFLPLKVCLAKFDRIRLIGAGSHFAGQKPAQGLAVVDQLKPSFAVCDVRAIAASEFPCRHRQELFFEDCRVIKLS